jgi:hypothetical protein
VSGIRLCIKPKSNKNNKTGNGSKEARNEVFPCVLPVRENKDDAKCQEREYDAYGRAQG